MVFLFCVGSRSVGVLVLEEEDEKGLDLGVASIYITVIAWTMVGIGALYFLMVSEPRCFDASEFSIDVCRLFFPAPLDTLCCGRAG